MDCRLLDVDMGRLSMDRPQKNNNYYRIPQLKRLCKKNGIIVKAKCAKRRDYINALLGANSELIEKNEKTDSVGVSNTETCKAKTLSPFILSDSCCEVIGHLLSEIALLEHSITSDDYRSLLYSKIDDLEEEYDYYSVHEALGCGSVDYAGPYPGLLSNRTILDHIRHCCGHGDFLDELFKDYSADELPDDKAYSAFLLILSLILTQDLGIEYLDRLWSCIPLLNRSFKNSLFDYMDEESYEEDVKGKLFPDECRVDPKMLINYITCTNGNSLFKVLMGGSCGDLLISYENLKLAIESGAYVPDSFLKIHKAMSPVFRCVQAVMDFFGEECFCLYFRIQMSDYLYEFWDEYIPNQPYNIIPVFSYGHIHCEEFDVGLFEDIYRWICHRGEKDNVTGFLAWIKNKKEERLYEELYEEFCSDPYDDFDVHEDMEWNKSLIARCISEYKNDWLVGGFKEPIEERKIEEFLAYISQDELSQFLDSLGMAEVKISVEYQEVTLKPTFLPKSAKSS